MKSDSKHPLQLLAINEKRVQQLYELYAEKLPEWRDFWSSIAKEEDRHARLFLDLLEKTSVTVYDNRFDSQAIQKYIDETNELIETVSNEGTTIKEALQNSMRLESSFVENKIFDVMEVDSPEMKKVLETQRKETEEHYQRVYKEWQKIKE